MSVTFHGSEVLEIAINIERNGVEFYREAAKKAKDERLKALFEELSLWEAQHVRDFSALKGVVDADWAETYAGTEAEVYMKALADSRVFTEVERWAEEALRSADPKEAIKAALIAEKESILLYYAMLDATKGRSKEVVREILRQERAHLSALSKAYEHMERGGDLGAALETLRGAIGQPPARGDE